MLKVFVYLQATALGVADRLERRLTSDRGQSTAEYALVLLGAAGVAMLLFTWATRTGKISQLLNSVMDRVLSRGS